MNCSAGIDLGSTTTKALIIDEDGVVVGRGITNSRSSYDVACQVALSEALIDARFWMVASDLGQAGIGGERGKDLVAALEWAFRAEQYLEQLRTLGSVIGGLVAKRTLAPARSAAVERILERMSEEGEALFAGGASRRSDFFRDLAGSSYLRLATEESRRSGVAFELLVGLFDKAILEVENTPPAPGTFSVHALRALRRTGETGEMRPELAAAVERAAAADLRLVARAGTGYGRARLPFPKDEIRSEILCHGLGAHAMFPGTRTVLDIGGQDTKAIQVDGGGVVTSFQMNDRCAAGCGRYLGYIADEMDLGLCDLGPLAQKSCRPLRINSTCTVFAGAELRQRLSLGERREDILAGLHRAIILRAMSLLARSGGVKDELTFTGGVARNPAAVDALRKLVVENYGEVTINISPDSIYTGAFGAALFGLRSLRPLRPDPCARER